MLPKNQWLSARDLAVVARLFILLPIAWLIAESNWSPFLKRIETSGRRGLRESRLATIRKALPSTPAEDAFLQYQLDFSFQESILQVLRIHRPGGWTPILRVIGIDRIEKSLKQGNGALFWISECASSALVTKMALHQEGYVVSHLSRPEHGFSSTRFGQKFLNPIWTKAEEKYLRERIVIKQDRTLSAVRRMSALLNKNQLVSVTVGRKGRKTAELAFLNGRISLATGALNLAAASRAAVLPVFTVRKSYREFEVVIDPPLSFDLPCNRHESIEIMLRRYVQRLEPYVSEHPGQWLGWDGLFQAPPDNAPPSLS